MKEDAVTPWEAWDIKSKTLKELQEEFAQKGLPKFRALQVFRWLQRGVGDFSQMTDLSKDLRQDLAQSYRIVTAEVAQKRVSKDGTVKYLFRLFDEEYVESVLMCSFCATGKSGFSRNLAASEILSQVQAASQDAGVRISHIVLMGMGEPLDNYENVLRFLELVTSPEGLQIGMRHISLSTCGIVDKIYDLADRKYQLTLSVSLHAPNDAIRSRTMPINNRWNIGELLQACKYYGAKTGRRISFEYALIQGVNDTDACALELAGRLKGILAHVNLIPVNDVTGTGYRKSRIEQQKRFVSLLESRGIPATVRRTLGSDIEASCGQLRRKVEGGNDHES